MTVTPEPTTTASPEPTTTASPEPTTTASPEPTTTASPEPTTTASPEPTTTASPDNADVVQAITDLQGSVELGVVVVALVLFFLVILTMQAVRR